MAGIGERSRWPLSRQLEEGSAAKKARWTWNSGARPFQQGITTSLAAAKMDTTFQTMGPNGNRPQFYRDGYVQGVHKNDSRKRTSNQILARPMAARQLTQGDCTRPA
jgi:hypothetical protein